MHTKISAIVIVLFILVTSFYFCRKSGIPQNSKNLNNYYDSFQSFNNRQEIDSTFCHPYFPSPMESDTRPLSAPITISCSTWMEQLAELNDDGFLVISDKIFEKRKANGNDNYTCCYTQIVTFGENAPNVSPIEWKVEPCTPTKVPFESFVVLCRDPLGNFFYIRSFLDFSQRIAELVISDSTADTFSLLLISISGLSENQAMRHLQKTLDFAAQNDFVSFSMFNQASSKNSENRKMNFYGDGSEKDIFQLAKESDCLLSVVLDPRIADSSEFNETDFSTKLYNSYNNEHLIFRNESFYCLYDGRSISEDLIQISDSLNRKIRNKCHVAFLELTEITEHFDGAISSIDESLKGIVSGVDFRNTNVVLVSDGGNGEIDTWHTENGRHEAKLGVFMVRMADEFRDSHQEKMYNLNRNVDRLITNSDVFRTLSAMISNNSQNSLLDKLVDENRNCQNANISESNCICSKPFVFRSEERMMLVKKLEEVIRKEFSILKCITKIVVPPVFKRSDEIRSLESSILVESEIFIHARPTYAKQLPEKIYTMLIIAKYTRKPFSVFIISKKPTEIDEICK